MVRDFLALSTIKMSSFFTIYFQVNDYVKNYIGDGKGPKNFAKDYVERRSKWRNALKSKKKFEDDLLTPAAAINPNNDDEVRNSIFQFNGFFVRFRCLFFVKNRAALLNCVYFREIAMFRATKVS